MIPYIYRQYVVLSGIELFSAVVADYDNNKYGKI